MPLTESIKILKGVGEKRAHQLENIGIYSINDLLTYYPRQGNYIDFSSAQTISSLKIGERQFFRAKIHLIQEKRSYKGRKYALVKVKDQTGYADIFLFGTQIFKIRNLKNGMDVLITGKVQVGKTAKMISDATIEVEDKESKVEVGILPTYPLTGTLTQAFMRSLIMQVLNLVNEDNILEIIPQSIEKKHGFISRLEAILNIHYPKNWAMLKKARTRLAFEELYVIQCGLLFYRNMIKNKQKGFKHGVTGDKVSYLLDNLPFKLTDEQEKAWQDISNDMEDIAPMHRLLQGDVGSGKTIIAILALLKAVENGFQGAFMAPTEILAGQHKETLADLLVGIGVNVALLTGSTTKARRNEILQQLAEGEIDILIGTHALIQKDVLFKNLSLVVTDEQHRFGVKQRAGLTDKSYDVPDTLVMTATPIPRTMALTVYGDLDVSIIRKLPPGRKTIVTLCYNQTKRQEVYQGLVRQIKLGRQAYVVCPLIEESEKISTLSASELYDNLKENLLKDIPVALLHGKMKQVEKDAIMADFVANKIKVLISTTVIEVGINVPNASLMIVEGAERFGLAQLHQLRGRIGRGEHQSYCALISGSSSLEITERLKLMCQHSDGFALAEEDLKLRGAGSLFGTRQHGLPDLRLANIFTDTDLLLLARECAKMVVDDRDAIELVKRYINDNYEENFATIFSS